MTPADCLLEQLQNCQKDIDRSPTHDCEEPHARADAALIQYLRAVGLTQQADVFDNMRKWYA